MADRRVIAPAKINLHLEVLGLRPDGFHELAMLMQSIDLVDRLHLQERSDGEITLQCTHPDLSVGPDNLIVKAAQGLRALAGLETRGVEIHLDKQIPIGAGLAGGSSDAAATLVGLAELWGLKLSPGELQQLAGELGSDVPFCLAGGGQLCFGRGERLEPGPQSVSPLGVLLLKDPQVTVSTPWAYQRCKEWRGDFYLSREADFEERRQALRESSLVRALRGEGAFPPLRNDLQPVVAQEVPSVARALELLHRTADPLAVAMSGSGPTVFALFADPTAAALAQAALAGALVEAGLQSWCCGLRSSGASLLEASSSP